MGFHRILALAAHPDDIELGCGATLHKFTEGGASVKAVIFSDCRDAVPTGWREDAHRKECKSAMNELGVDDLTVGDFRNKHLSDRRQKVLDALYHLRNDNPDLVLVCSTYNSHQDHLVVTQEAKRAFRGVSIFGYSLPHSDYGFASDAIYSSVEVKNVNAKMQALKEYKSQFVLKRTYFSIDYLKATMMAYGGEIGIPYAEKFQNIREIL